MGVYKEGWYPRNSSANILHHHQELLVFYSCQRQDICLPGPWSQSGLTSPSILSSQGLWDVCCSSTSVSRPLGQAKVKKVQYFLWGENQVILLWAEGKVSCLCLPLSCPKVKRTSCRIPEPSPCSFIAIYLAFKTPYFALNFKLSFSSLLLSFPISDSCSLFDTGQVTEPWPCNYGWSHRTIFMPCQRLFTYQECIFKWQALNWPL